MYSTLQSVQCDPCGIWHLSALRTKEGNDPSFCRWSFEILSSLSAERAGSVRDESRETKPPLGRSGGFLRAAETHETRLLLTHY